MPLIRTISLPFVRRRGFGRGFGLSSGLYLTSRGAGVTASLRREMSHRSRLRRNAIDDELEDYIFGNTLLREYEDRRSHDFKRVRPAKGVVAVSSRLVAVPGYEEKTGKYRERIGFHNASRVIICAKRRMRKEVLLAKKKVGAGKGGSFRQRKPKYNEFSRIVCV